MSLETSYFYDMDKNWINYGTEKKMNIRAKLMNAFRSHAQGHIDKHVANVEVYLHNPAGVGEHPDIMEAIEMEMEEVAKYHDMLEMIDKYFVDDPTNGNR